MTMFVRSLFLLLLTPSFVETCESSRNVNVRACFKEMNRKTPGWNTSTLCDTQNEDQTIRCENVAPFCDRNFRLSIFKQQLFTITMKNTLLSMLSHCCRWQARCSVVNVLEDSLVNTSVLISSDIVFPVIAKSETKTLHGFHFLEAFQVRILESFITSRFLTRSH